MKKQTLVILAAGLGSRYGGLKQLDAMTSSGDSILDFSVYDAIESGFTKIVFVIRNSFKDEFKSVFENKLKGKIKYAFVCQEVSDIPSEIKVGDRLKPWGTGHALLVAKDLIEGNFAVINADDFYGKKAFEVMANQLQKSTKNSTVFSMVGFRLKNTISVNGAVSRGECIVDDANKLLSITERTHIERINEAVCYKNDKGVYVEINENTIVSMNFWGFTPQFFYFLEKQFYQFLKAYQNDLKKEFFLPSVVNELIQQKLASVTVLTSDSKWLGVTYKEDKKHVVEQINILKEEGIYPNKLW